MTTTLSPTTYLYSDYDPVKYYDTYATPADFYAAQDFYIYNEFFDELSMPLPNLANFGNM